MARARQRHIQQAQVFFQAGGVELHARFLGPGEIEAAHAILAGVEKEAAVAPVDRPGADRKRQKHQRVFQALGLVHGNHLHQLGIAFQAQDALVAALAVIGDLLGQPADQGMFAIQVLAGRLQHFGQVQEVGQAAFAAALAQQPRPAGRARG